MIKLNRKKETDKPMYRIECRQCRKLVPRGIGFPNEPAAKSMERIKLYEEEIHRQYYGGKEAISDGDRE